MLSIQPFVRANNVAIYSGAVLRVSPPSPSPPPRPHTWPLASCCFCWVSGFTSRCECGQQKETYSSRKNDCSPVGVAELCSSIVKPMSTSPTYLTRVPG
jgi:hypothetical protein